uniref:Coiled-coil domain containing 198 n=1 Tax=Rousettus aegyptiacus TaxID=9407 RepID=A0A7J8IH07_ROUAE|nr:coiled-coil domain containing 198 [Rousettus aegyptiacus]
MTSERILRQQEGRTTHKAKELEKKMQTPMYISGKRQYLHKMQMLEMNRKRQEAQMELKKSHREARINKQKLRDHQAKKILQSIPKNDDGDFLTLLPDETLNRSPGQIPTSARLMIKKSMEMLALPLEVLSFYGKIISCKRPCSC